MREPQDVRARHDRMLFARNAGGDRSARAELVERFLPLARSIARRYERRGEPLDDLLQVASLGLVKAIDRYDPDHGTAFSSYAVPTISGELKRYFRDRTWAVRPPRDLLELTLRVDHAATALLRELDRSPTVAELAKATGSSDEQILEALQARGARGAISLQGPTAGHGETAEMQDMLGNTDDGYERAEDRAVLDALLACLPGRSREILRMRFEEDLNQSEIAVRFGISQMQISRIIRDSLAQLSHVVEQQQRVLERA